METNTEPATYADQNLTLYVTQRTVHLDGTSTWDVVCPDCWIDHVGYQRHLSVGESDRECHLCHSPITNACSIDRLSVRLAARAFGNSQTVWRPVFDKIESEHRGYGSTLEYVSDLFEALMH